MLERNESDRIRAARAGDHEAFISLIEPHRHELLVHCYRLVGSLQDAEDLVQETFFKAWRRLDSFAGRASFRAWLYKIATNTSLDALARHPRRFLPSQRYAAADPSQPFIPVADEGRWLEPLPDTLLTGVPSDPAARYDLHESVALAFLAALQLLPPRQRAVLILRDVLDWQAREVAAFLETSLSAVNSALHRARTTLADHVPDEAGSPLDARDDPQTTALLERYVQAWETANITALTALLKDDATLAMPPSPSWYHGRQAITAFVAAAIFAPAMASPWRLEPVHANRQPAFVLYQPEPLSGNYLACGIQVLTLVDGQVAAITNFMTPQLTTRFDWPLVLRA